MKYKMGNSRKSLSFTGGNLYFTVFIGWDIPPKDNSNECRFKAMMLDDSLRRYSSNLGKINVFFRLEYI